MPQTGCLASCQMLINWVPCLVDFTGSVPLVYANVHTLVFIPTNTRSPVYQAASRPLSPYPGSSFPTRSSPMPSGRTASCLQPLAGPPSAWVGWGLLASLPLMTFLSPSLATSCRHPETPSLPQGSLAFFVSFCCFFQESPSSSHLHHFRSYQANFCSP